MQARNCQLHLIFFEVVGSDHIENFFEHMPGLDEFEVLDDDFFELFDFMRFFEDVTEGITQRFSALFVEDFDFEEL